MLEASNKVNMGLFTSANETSEMLTKYLCHTVHSKKVEGDRGFHVAWYHK